MATETIELPDIGDFADVPVIEILVQPGDVVNVDDPLLTLESDKATLEVPSPKAGKVAEWLIKLNDLVSTGNPILKLEIADGVSPSTSNAKDTEKEVAPEPIAQTSPPLEAEPERSEQTPQLVTAPALAAASRDKVHASPSVRAFARELGIDLTLVVPSGRNGRILREDVTSFVKKEVTTSAATPSIGFELAPALQIDHAAFGDVQIEPLTRIQKVAGARLSRNAIEIPHVTNFDHADVTDLEAFRKQMNVEMNGAAAKLTMVAFLVKASALALRAYPRFNTSISNDQLIIKNYVHIGVAVDTPRGLLVPVIRDADQKGLFDIAEDLSDLAAKARDGKLSPNDMKGASFSVSSLGGVPGDGFTPIINAPEVAILGAARSRIQAVWDQDKFVPRLIMPISVSWDHRVIDGVLAARFLSFISSVLSDVRRIAL